MTVGTCPSCGTEAAGNFCSRCGASLSARSCDSCGAESRPGDRFCTHCGAPLGAERRPAAGPGSERSTPDRDGGDGSLGWWVAGLLLAAVMVFLLIPILSPERGRTDGAPAAGGETGSGGEAPALGPAPNVDLESMTPREAADRLFDRVMSAAEAGDSVEAGRFLPMAIAAYERARPLDADGLFHLSVLLRTAGRADEALEVATGGLEGEPDHLLLLSAAAEAARTLADTAAAQRHFRHLLEVWDEETARGRDEYALHDTLLPRLREDARAFLGDAGGA